MRINFNPKIGIGIPVVLLLTLLGVSACVTTTEQAAKTPKKAKPKVSSQNTVLSCSMTGSRKSCVAVSPTPVAYKKKVKVLIAGSGFKPKQELGIRVMMGGVLSDISFLVKPRPIANKYGAFASVWKLNREIRRKLVKPGTAYTITVVDQDGNSVGTAPLVFDKAKKKGKKKKKK
ncbi:MAG: hypothetical protein ACE5HC_13185 [Candidatus Binatia bacterium]